MIIARAPFRLPLGGGGTDLPAYASRFGGALVTSAINKYMYVAINKPSVSGHKIRLHYSNLEDVDKVSEIKHDLIRSALGYYQISGPIEISSTADFPSGTGMGSSSVFTVALCAGLRSIWKLPNDTYDLAHDAYIIENVIAQKPVGVQDHYASAFGGINKLLIGTDGDITITPVMTSNIALNLMGERLVMFYTGICRDSYEILDNQQQKIVDNEDVTSAMHVIKLIGIEMANSFETAHVDDFMDNMGKMFDQHWELKRTISNSMSNAAIDMFYETALNNGAIGGKIMGAGGGGMLLLCSEEGKKDALIRAMVRVGMQHIPFEFEFEGAKIVYRD